MFDVIWDDFQGRVSQYVKVVYENNFLEDFLQAQLNAFQAGEKDPAKKFLSRVPDVLYQQY